MTESAHSPYSRLLKRAIANRWWVLGGVALLFAASILLYPLLGRELFPTVDAGQIVVRMRAPSGTRIENSEKLAFAAEATIRRTIPPADIDTIVANTGVLYDWPAAYTPNAGPMDTFFAVQLSGSHRTTSQEYARRLRPALAAQFPGVGFSFNTGGLLSAALNSGLPSPIDVQVTGNDVSTAQMIALEVKQAIEETSGTVDVRIEQKNDYPQLNVQIDRVKAAYLGLNTDDVVKNLLTALNSSVTFQPAFWLDEQNGNHYFLGAQYPESEIQTTDTLANIPLTGSGDMNQVIGAMQRTDAESPVPPTLRQPALRAQRHPLRRRTLTSRMSPTSIPTLTDATLQVLLTTCKSTSIVCRFHLDTRLLCEARSRR
jgi:multidrug efflux pump subunit AcrB